MVFCVPSNHQRESPPCQPKHPEQQKAVYLHFNQELVDQILPETHLIPQPKLEVHQLQEDLQIQRRDIMELLLLFE